MRKGFLTVLAVVLVAAMAAPAMADFSSSGFIRIKGHVEQNYRVGGAAGTQGGLFILPGKDVATASYVEQRQRFALNYKGENVGAVGLFEIDFANWGDSAYTAGRNQGAGLEADSINLETKNFYLWFNVPNTSVKVAAGLQNQTDSFGGMIFGYADMAGVFVTGKMDPVSYKLGFAKFQEGTSLKDDDVDLYVAEAKFTPTKDTRVGVDLYILRDASGGTAAGSGTFGTNLNTIGRLGADYPVQLGATSFTYQPSNFYYLGVDGAVKAGPVGLSGFAFYNFGTVELPVGTLNGSVLDNTDKDVKAWAVDLRADADLGPGKAFIEGAYVSGTGDNDSDFKSPVTAGNYALAGSFALTSMDMQILLNSLDDINASAALAYDVQNKGRGIIVLAAGFRMKFSDMLSGKVGVGYLTDAKNTVGSPVKKHKATEVNANVNYSLVKGLDLGLYGAYAFLTDWEDYGAQSVGAATLTQDADDIYKAYLRMNYAF
ncbi:MAG: hypothetical protein A2X90_06720 [Deltaproteobacteria bacterium GWA2_65_63]|nr:MAG: hypothetical protein A2X90_06720 [Deltaproteobacteria bacterium GWA2_65_63]